MRFLKNHQNTKSAGAPVLAAALIISLSACGNGGGTEPVAAAEAADPVATAPPSDQLADISDGSAVVSAAEEHLEYQRLNAPVADTPTSPASGAEEHLEYRRLNSSLDNSATSATAEISDVEQPSLHDEKLAQIES